MKIKNESRLDTKALRRLIGEVARREGYAEPGYLRRLHVEVVPGRTLGWHGGRGAVASLLTDEAGAPVRYVGRWIKLSIPREVSPAQLAGTIRHEMAHNYGMRHDKMGPDLLWSKPLEWAAAFELPERAVRTAASANPERRLEHARQMLRLARTRAKRAATIVKRWERRVRRLS
jgi:hypothetical protein